MQTIKLMIGIIGALITLISQMIFKVLIGFLTPLSEFFRKILNKIHLSIAFKLNLVYGFTYMIIFSLVYSFSIVFYVEYIENKVGEPYQLMAFKGFIAIIIGIAFIILLCVGKIVTKGLQNSLEKMNDTMKHIDVNDLHNRLDISGTKDELKDLAQTFNGMMDQLEQFINSQKQFVSDASHELRTPIAVIQGYANMLSRWGLKDPEILEESIQCIKEEAENMQQLVEKLLFLARADKKTQVVKLEPLNLSDIAKDIIKHTKLIDDTHEIKESIEDDVMILGDKSLIKELLRIFIDNALKYTEAEGKIEMIIKHSGQNAIVSIRDNGKGIAKERIPHIFERFYQEDEARTHSKGSSGLGLAIAKWIIEAHEGKIYVTSIEGEGTEFIVFFNFLQNDA